MISFPFKKTKKTPKKHDPHTRLCVGSRVIPPIHVHYLEFSLLLYSCSPRHKPLLMYLSSINHAVLVSGRVLCEPAGPDYICRHLVGVE